jgi:hypothetical protein
LALVLACLIHVLPRVARVALSVLLRLGSAGVVPHSSVTMRLRFVMVCLTHIHVGIAAFLTRVRFCLTRSVGLGGCTRRPGASAGEAMRLSARIP